MQLSELAQQVLLLFFFIWPLPDCCDLGTFQVQSLRQMLGSVWITS
jgi:hypothetical protein